MLSECLPSFPWSSCFSHASIPPLTRALHTEMTDAAGEAGKPMILINPKLGDIQSGERGG